MLEKPTEADKVTIDGLTKGEKNELSDHFEILGDCDIKEPLDALPEIEHHIKKWVATNIKVRYEGIDRKIHDDLGLTQLSLLLIEMLNSQTLGRLVKLLPAEVSRDVQKLLNDIAKTGRVETLESVLKHVIYGHLTVHLMPILQVLSKYKEWYIGEIQHLKPLRTPPQEIKRNDRWSGFKLSEEDEQELKDETRLLEQEVTQFMERHKSTRFDDEEALFPSLFLENLAYQFALRESTHYVDCLAADKQLYRMLITDAYTICENASFTHNAFGYSFEFKQGKFIGMTAHIFTFNEKEYLNAYAADPQWKTKAECYKRYYQDKDKQKIIAADLEISQSSVAKYIDEVQGRLSFDMGQAYENYFEKVVAPRRYKRYVRMGGKGQPDGVGYRADSIEVVSLKCHNATRGSSDTIHRSGLRAEIEYAKKLIQEGSKNVKAVLVYHELNRNLDFDRDIDLNDENQKITINFDIQRAGK